MSLKDKGYVEKGGGGEPEPAEKPSLQGLCCCALYTSYQ